VKIVVVKWPTAKLYGRLLMNANSKRNGRTRGDLYLVVILNTSKLCFERVASMLMSLSTTKDVHGELISKVIVEVGLAWD
jgi:hypothetical protein